MCTALNCGVGRVSGVQAGCIFLVWSLAAIIYTDTETGHWLGSRKLLGHVTVDTHCYGYYVYTTLITIQSGVYSNTAWAMGMTATTCVLSNPCIDCWCSDHARNIFIQIISGNPSPKAPSTPWPHQRQRFFVSPVSHNKIDIHVTCDLPRRHVSLVIGL